MSNVHDNSTSLHCLHCWVVTVFKIWFQSSELKIGPAQVRFASSLGFFFHHLFSFLPSGPYSCLAQFTTHSLSSYTRKIQPSSRHSWEDFGKRCCFMRCRSHSPPPFLLPLPSHLTLQSEGGVGSHDSLSLPLPTSPHGVRFGWGTMSLVCMLTLGIWNARMFYQESRLYSVLKLLYLKGD